MNETNDLAAGVASPPDWRRNKPSLEQRLYHWLSDEWGGNDTVPGTSLDFRFRETTWPDIANPHNDGSELWIGTMDRWHTHMERSEAHRLALWILVTWWGKGEWFGLKRWLWYKLLFRRVNRYRLGAPR